MYGCDVKLFKLNFITYTILQYWSSRSYESTLYSLFHRKLIFLQRKKQKGWGPGLPQIVQSSLPSWWERRSSFIISVPRHYHKKRITGRGKMTRLTSHESRMSLIWPTVSVEDRPSWEMDVRRVVESHKMFAFGSGRRSQTQTWGPFVRLT